MKLEYQEYKPRKLVNVHRQVDGPWFWTKYSAHPYVGCRSGCSYCYLRGGRYLGKRDAESFDTLIQVKVNAPALLRKELARLEPEILNCGDWQQPAEAKYQLSRRMLEVLAETEFPLLVIERSPFLLRDLDLLQEINRKTWVGVIFSVSGLATDIKRAFEPRSPGVMRRFQAMKALAETGILVGTALMPVIPFVGDHESQLENVVLTTRDHGGKFVLVGGLTMSGTQAKYTLRAAHDYSQELAADLQKMYRWSAGARPSYGPPKAYSAQLGRKVRRLCDRHGLADRMPRFIQPGPLAVNKKISERLFLKTYDLELAEAADFRVWAYRKAAWTADTWPKSLAKIFQEEGEPGLQSLPNIGRRIAGEIARWFAANAL